MGGPHRRRAARRAGLFSSTSKDVKFTIAGVTYRAGACNKFRDAGAQRHVISRAFAPRELVAATSAMPATEA
jgi:hypothetical protein